MAGDALGAEQGGRDASDRIYQEQRLLSMDRLARQPVVLDRIHLAATGVRAVDQETRRLAS